MSQFLVLMNHHGFSLFKASGYVTAYYGKYLNRYSGDHVPSGWSRWAGLVRNSRYYNYTLNIDGKLEHHGDRYETDYLPDLITNKTLALIREMEDSSSPFMAVLGEFLFCGCINNYMLILTLTYEIFEGYPAPHGPEDSAPQHQMLFLNTTTHHTPAYDHAPNPDKQWILRHTERMLPVHRRSV